MTPPRTTCSTFSTKIASIETTPRDGPFLAPVVTDEDEIFAAACSGSGFHSAVDIPGMITGQAELEEIFARRFPDAAKSLRADTDGRFKDLLAHGRSQGVWRQP